MVNVEKKQYHFSSADEDVLEYFNIANETNFAKLHEILINAYRKQSANTLNL